MRRAAVALAVAASALLGLSGCSSTKASGPPQSDLTACAAVDAMYALITHHDKVPSLIAQRVISAGEAATDGSITVHARVLQADVTASDDQGVESELTALGTRCDKLGVGPTKY